MKKKAERSKKAKDTNTKEIKACRRQCGPFVSLRESERERKREERERERERES
jgi:hypothetical protein